MKVASAVGVVARVAGRVLLWLMPTLLAYVDYEFGSMDFSWDSNEDRCNLGEIFANIDKIFVDWDIPTLREIHAKCMCVRDDCENLPMQSLANEVGMPFDVVLSHMILRFFNSGSMLYRIWTTFSKHVSPSRVASAKTCIERVLSCAASAKTCIDRVLSCAASAKTCIDRVLSCAAGLNVRVGSARLQSKFSDKDLDQVISVIQCVLLNLYQEFDERMQRELSELLLRIPRYAMGTKWKIIFDKSGDCQGTELKNQKLADLLYHNRCIAEKEWTALCITDITPSHYVRCTNSKGFVYYPDPFVFGRREDRESILKVCEDAAFRVELSKNAQLCRDLLALDAQQQD